MTLPKALKSFQECNTTGTVLPLDSEPGGETLVCSKKKYIGVCTVHFYSKLSMMCIIRGSISSLVHSLY